MPDNAIDKEAMDIARGLDDDGLLCEVGPNIIARQITAAYAERIAAYENMRHECRLLTHAGPGNQTSEALTAVLAALAALDALEAT